MLKDSHDRRLWIRDEYGRHTPVMSQADIANRPRGRSEPDWWVVAKDPAWTPPEPRSLLSLGATDAGGADGATGSGTGGHTKIGAGHKPQGYDGHGRYTGPRGGSISMDGGPVRLYEGKAAGEPGGEPDAAEPEAEGEAGQAAAEEVSRQIEGILVADSGQIASDAGGGLSGGTEVRGPVTPPPANVTWKNDDPDKPDPRKEDLSPGAQKTMTDVRTEVPRLESVNANSGQRDDGGPHSTGRAVDINNVNGIRVKDLQSGSGEKAEQAREAAANLEKWAVDKPEIKQLIGPNGGWTRDRDSNPVPIVKQEVLDAHKNHYHITTTW